MSLTDKLNPDNFTALAKSKDLASADDCIQSSSMSGIMAAILGYILGETWSEPEIRELHVTADGFLLARRSGDIGCNDFIGGLGDWDANLRRLFEVAEVTTEEQQEFAELWQHKVIDWRKLTDCEQSVTL